MSCNVEEVELFDPEWTVAQQIAHNLDLKKPRIIPSNRTEPSSRELNEMERTALGGITLSGASLIVDNANWIEDRIYTQEEYEALDDGDYLTVGGEITEYKAVQIKNGRDKGRNMCFVTVQYGENVYPCTMFADTYSEYKDLLDATAVMVYGRKNIYKEKSSIVVLEIGELEKLVKDIDDG